MNSNKKTYINLPKIHLSSFRISFLIVLIAFSNQIYAQSKEPVECVIYKIDSVNNYYTIYAGEMETDKRYKIVTKKQDNQGESCEKIRIGGKYELTIERYFKELPVEILSLDIDYEFPNKTLISVDCDWGCDLFSAKEIIGLTYSKEEL